jgi:Na+/proline symporter
MTLLDYFVIAVYFVGLIAVSGIISRRIKSSEDMFIAGRNSSWWLSGMSTYMTLFSASTFVVWGGVAYRSGLVAALVGNLLGLGCFFAGRYIAGRWRELRIKSPGEFLGIRFGHSTVNFYTLIGIIGRGGHTAVALYAIAIVVSTLVQLPEGHILADPATGQLSVVWAIILLGIITLIYTVTGGFLAVLMTDVIQFGVLITVVIFMIPMSIQQIGGLDTLIAQAPEGYFVPASPEYPFFWLVMWFFLNLFTVGGDWPFIQRYISVPTPRDARKSNYLVGVLYLVTPIIWYLPAMIYRIIDPNANPEQAYILMSKLVLMKGMLGVMLAAMISATLSCVSGTLNVYANVFTYDIYCKRHPEASERQRIRVGRLFTLLFGLSILLVALLIPYAGGAEKVVITILTLVIAPLCIPTVWGLFSKRITGKQVIAVMLVTYAVGLTLRFAVDTGIRPQVLESASGLFLPVSMLTLLELYGRCRHRQDPAYEQVAQLHEELIDETPSEEARRATRNYSHMAISCFMATLSGVALLLLALFFTETFTESVRSIVLWSSLLMLAMVALYVGYRVYEDKQLTK